ncbi:hypothetical protein GGR57DRAFT_271927 [Xylariaceae sp. FL1272]|nr:hypothetical protein GGR57DRAFT_271927 [Xylariaceae sp. FL1272]
MSIVGLVATNNILLVHEPYISLIRIFRHAAAIRRVQTVFTTAFPSTHKQLVVIHPESSRFVIQQLIPSSVGVFISFANAKPSVAAQQSVVKCVSSRCTFIAASSLLGRSVEYLVDMDISFIGENLRRACQCASITDEPMLQANALSLANIAAVSGSREDLTVIDWDAGSVNAEVLPIVTDSLFRADKTYLLAGMTGELGHSLCGWMVAHGARNVILSSRSPKVDAGFIDDMKKCGANIKSLPLDITCRSSVFNTLTKISGSMASIAGVVNVPESHRNES